MFRIQTFEDGLSQDPVTIAEILVSIANILSKVLPFFKHGLTDSDKQKIVFVAKWAQSYLQSKGYKLSVAQAGAIIGSKWGANYVGKVAVLEKWILKNSLNGKSPVKPNGKPPIYLPPNYLPPVTNEASILPIIAIGAVAYLIIK